MTSLVSANYPSSVTKAAHILQDGGLVVIPTETVYGLGANAFNPNSVARIFEVKKRPSFDPLIVHITNDYMLNQVVKEWSDLAERLSKRFWPGPLTLVVPKSSQVPHIVTSGLENVAVRFPFHAVAREIIEACGLPVAAPSANMFGQLSPTTAAHVLEGLPGPDLIVDAGPCSFGLESTIVDLSLPVPGVLRHGAIPIEELWAIEPSIIDLTVYSYKTSKEISHQSFDYEGVSGDANLNIVAPGQLQKHYAPRTRLRVINRGDDFDRNCFYLAFREPPEGEVDNLEVLSPVGSLNEAASRLFDLLHFIDKQNNELIVAELVPAKGLGLAINDRLLRAAATFT